MNERFSDLMREVRFSTRDIEEQHGQLAGAIDALEQVVSAGSEADIEKAVAGFIDFTASYFLYHSFTEEKLMYENGYPRDDYFAHVMEHKRMILELIALQHTGRTALLNASGTAPKERALHLIRSFHDWFAGHISKADQKLIDFLTQRGL